ncbi:MAG TPA: hypothetical protein VGM10_18740 [Actinocrinis sp.]|jgi:hypothetical protein
MPRPNLKRAQRLVRAYCADHGVAYRECSSLESYGQALNHLRAIDAACTPLTVATHDTG